MGTMSTQIHIMMAARAPMRRTTASATAYMWIIMTFDLSHMTFRWLFNLELWADTWQCLDALWPNTRTWHQFNNCTMTKVSNLYEEYKKYEFGRINWIDMNYAVHEGKLILLRTALPPPCDQSKNPNIYFNSFSISAQEPTLPAPLSYN